MRPPSKAPIRIVPPRAAAADGASVAGAGVSPGAADTGGAADSWAGAQATRAALVPANSPALRTDLRLRAGIADALEGTRRGGFTARIRARGSHGLGHRRMPPPVPATGRRHAWPQGSYCIQTATSRSLCTICGRPGTLFQVRNEARTGSQTLLIRGGTVFDGSGGPGVRANVVIEGSRIVAVGPEASESAARVLDADGLAVAPGFIDMHSHADFTLPAYPGALNSLAQGVTTEVIGNCGYSPAPVSALARHASDQIAACHGLGPDLDWSWRSFDEYLGALGRARPAVNCIPLVGHGMLRLAVVGAEDRAATDSELAEMRGLLADALAAGAWGMSTGLVYPPGSYAATDGDRPRRGGTATGGRHLCQPYP